MKTYTIKGMGCTGCAATVEERLSKVAGVTAVKVDFDAQKAFVESKEEVSSPVLQKALELGLKPIVVIKKRRTE